MQNNEKAKNNIDIIYNTVRGKTDEKGEKLGEKGIKWMGGKKRGRVDEESNRDAHIHGRVLERHLEETRLCIETCTFDMVPIYAD